MPDQVFDTLPFEVGRRCVGPELTWGDGALGELNLVRAVVVGGVAKHLSLSGTIA